MRHLPAASRQAQPWKNGGGTTSTVAVWPEGAGLEAIGWRLSIAEVAEAGPFSSFPGIDRRLAMLAGRLELRFADRTATLDPASPALAFAGDEPVSGLPYGGLATDLNLMVDRARFTARLEPVSAPVDLHGDPRSHRLLLVTTPAPAQGGLPALAARDALWLAPGTTGHWLVPAPGWLATITPR
ncbi:MAG: HutD family protein [Proteobacteria bacterium]|nr:HutD family protein [Pseudomonadota bacterium]